MYNEKISSEFMKYINFMSKYTCFGVFILMLFHVNWQIINKPVALIRCTTYSYCNGSKLLGMHVWANSVDQDKAAPSGAV